jgi:glucuronokinase
MCWVRVHVYLLSCLVPLAHNTKGDAADESFIHARAGKKNRFISLPVCDCHLYGEGRTLTPMIIRSKAYPRAALVGNPSDGYFGKTIAFVFSNFYAQVVLYESPELQILPNIRDHSRFKNIHGLAEDVRDFGYYGGIRLLKASIKRFHDYCREGGIALHDRNFTVHYESDIPHLVGLAGSSAIITACFRSLMQFYEVDVPKPELPNLVLSVEKDELGISAGLQDRVAQAYQGVVFMDFDRDIMDSQGHGHYESIDPALLPPMYIAYRQDLAQGSEVFHNNIRYRFDRGDEQVIAAMQFWSELTDRVRDCLLAGRREEIGPLLDSNFDRRADMYEISEGNHAMVKAARSVGASAKFTGSGGAIIGGYDDEVMLEALKARLEPMHIRVLTPTVVPGE